MKKFVQNFLKYTSLSFLFLLFFVSALHAQEIKTAQVDSIGIENNLQSEIPLQAVAGEDKNIIVGRQIVFNAERSIGPEDLTYLWYFGDGTSKSGLEVNHTYNRSGVYRVELIIRDRAGRQVSDELIVTVAEDIIVFISDNTLSQQELNVLRFQAASQGILLVSIYSDSNSPDYIVQKQLARQLQEARTDILQAKSIIIATRGQIGLNALVEAYQPSNSQQQVDTQFFNNTVIVNAIDGSFFPASRIAKTVFNVLQPESIILVESLGLEHAVTNIGSKSIISDLHQSESKYSLVGVHSQRDLEHLGVFNFISFLVSYLVNQGVPINTLYLILILPVIATVISIARQVIGLKSFGIYTPMLITLSFAVLGLKYGLIFFAIIMSAATIMRLIGKRLRLMYIPRMAILLIVTSFAILLTYFIGIYFGEIDLVNVSILPIVILITLSENFISAQMEKGTLSAIVLTLQTIFVSMICYFIISNNTFREFILGFPEVLLLTIVINMLLGRWTGLRLLEYSRFYYLMNLEGEEE